MQTLTSPMGEYSLARYPVRNNETLRAWDAADELVLNHLAEENILTPDSKILILNDNFGALGCALSDFDPIPVSDSWIAQQGALYNLDHNQIPQSKLTLLNSLADYGDKPEKYDLVILKITKSLAQLEDQLHRIRPFIKPETCIIGCGMVKGIHTSTLQLFEKIIGPTKTSLARKKARLIFTRFEPELEIPDNSYPKRYKLEQGDYLITNHANVFSREKLDIGTRFFIQNLPESKRYQSIVDLGCGNGIVGLIAAEKNPDAKLHFVDESHMAIASARENFQLAFPDRDADFLVTDCLQGIPGSSVDLILNNPPFHQQTAVGDFIAWQMFKESREKLKLGGELWVIGNRHLGYHIKLKKLFGNCTTVVSNKKFVILKAVCQ